MTEQQIVWDDDIDPDVNDTADDSDQEVLPTTDEELGR